MNPTRPFERTARSAILAVLLAGALLTAGCAGARRPEAGTDSGPAFRVMGDLQLPGPLDPSGARLADDGAAVRVVAGGRDWRVPLDPAGGWGLPVDAPDASSGESATRGAPADAADTEPCPLQGLSPDGRVRARVELGFLTVERRCARCRSGFRRLWRSRLPASGAVPPVVTGDRVFAGLVDNRVYAFRRRNGHRIWDADVESRVLLPTAWVERPDGRRILLVPVAPGGAAALLALDPDGGSRLARLELPAEATPVGGPIPLPGGEIAWAFEEYDPTEARLWRISLDPESAAPPADGGVPHTE